MRYFAKPKRNIAIAAIAGAALSPCTSLAARDGYLFNDGHLGFSLKAESYAVGGASYRYIVGGTGWLFNTDFIITF